jgi:hypothetical protein
VRVGAREMELDQSKLSIIILQYGRHVRGVKAVRPCRHERRERPRAYQRMHLRQIVDAEMLGLVHRSPVIGPTLAFFAHSRASGKPEKTRRLSCCATGDGASSKSAITNEQTGS